MFLPAGMLKAMTTIDRYILRLFGKVLLVCFGSLAGLYIVLETFNNLEEFLELGEKGGGLVKVLQGYFAPRIFSLFDRTSSLLALLAAIFTLTWLQKTNELTAIMAGGISRFRVVKPLIIAAVTVSVLAVINREVVIPQYGKKLVRNAQSWDGSKSEINHQYDYQTQVFMSGGHLLPNEQIIAEPAFRVPSSRLGNLVAKTAVYQRANENHPAGYLFQKVIEPKELDQLGSIYRGEQLLVALPSDTSWLEKGEAFLPSEVDVNQLEVGDAMQQYQTTPNLIAQIRNPGLDYGPSLRRIAHTRLLQPFLDLSLFLIGVPLVVSRGDKSLFVAAGACLGVLVLYFGITFLAMHLGDSGILRPYRAAIFPLLVFAPWAAWVLPRLNR